ncbi:MAG: phosphotransferase [Nitrospirota bacterium]|nr:phosphotransferase [Nitrospirota bacterium]
MKGINAFILAAGSGERLRPITNYIPKSLLPVLGKPILERVLEKVFCVPLNRVGINIHHKWEMIRDWVDGSPYAGKVRLFHEARALDTGGALKNAEQLLRKSVFLVHNSDIFSDISLEILIERHLSSGDLATLAVHNHQKFNNMLIDDRGRLKSIRPTDLPDHETSSLSAFTGIAVYSPEFLDFVPEGISSVVHAWQRALSAGYTIGTVDFTGRQWNDIGTPGAYSDAVFGALERDGETLYIHPSADCGKAEIEGYAVLERDCEIQGEAYLNNCIILPGSGIAEGEYLENIIVGPGFRVPAGASGIINGISPPDHILSCFSEKAETVLIGGGGSDRRYYRVRDKGKTTVLMECPKTDPDYQRHIIYTQFFRKYSLPVPEMLSLNHENTCPPCFNRDSAGMALYSLFEDLGDITLYSWLKCRKSPETIEKLYRRVIDILILLHTSATDNVSDCPTLQSRIFDYRHLRWETNYFIEMFVSGLKGTDINDRGRLDREFHSLAVKVDAFGKTIVHRDFQSRNIMVTRGDIPWIIDYQGARMGPPGYDIASILWDPYSRLDEETRQRLLDYYIKGMKKLDQNFNETEFRETLLPCRLQRHMQALGAYGFLSKAKGKLFFQKYIPLTLRYLNEETAIAMDEYPALYLLIKGL